MEFESETSPLGNPDSVKNKRALATKVREVRHNAPPDVCCQLNERKDNDASENTIKHQIDELIQRKRPRQRSASCTTRGTAWKWGIFLIANELFMDVNKNMNIRMLPTALRDLVSPNCS